MDKYGDMAYTNERGIEWLAMLSKPEIWNMWLSRVKGFARENKVTEKPDEYARKIIIEAIWHRGYVKDTTNNKNMARCALMLRTPYEDIRAKNGDLALNMNGMSVHHIPDEFVLFDEFLENIVRPML